MENNEKYKKLSTLIKSRVMPSRWKESNFKNLKIEIDLIEWISVNHLDAFNDMSDDLFSCIESFDKNNKKADLEYWLKEKDENYNEYFWKMYDKKKKDKAWEDYFL